MLNSYIKLENVTFKRNDRQIFSNISLDIGQAQIVNIFGPNGSGKTSLLRNIVGLSEPYSGTIKNKFQNDLNSEIIFLGHKLGLKKDLTVDENLIFTQEFYNLYDKDKINYALTKFKISKTRYTPVKYLSQGQQKIIGLLKMLIVPFSIWIIDEPYTSLDTSASEILDSVMEEHTYKKGAIIMTNHIALENKRFNVKNISIIKNE
ncbi:MAG: heme ABC exporter ATP-binding protein CcmA [Gammaproteobacteria bacterium]|nr:heme ABC exporter ATP-binding protein CcmA [Gammaproteobacteria bacterium]|tara:strand:- start:192 stop:806 length:615 start_codon:yes stop_codon:yes gene_type:complete